MKKIYKLLIFIIILAIVICILIIVKRPNKSYFTDDKIVELAGEYLGNKFNNGGIPKDIISKDYPIGELVTYFGTYSTIEKMFFKSKVSSPVIKIDDAKDKFKVECFRKSNDKYYTVYKVTEGGYFYVFWGTNRDFEVTAYDSFYIPKLKSKSDFRKIKEGTSTIEDVYEIDPAAEFLNLSRGCISYSLLEDGRVMEIEYFIDPHKELNENSIVKKKSVVERLGSITLENIYVKDLPR